MESVNWRLYRLVGRKTLILFNGNGHTVLESNMGLYWRWEAMCHVAVHSVNPVIDRFDWFGCFSLIFLFLLSWVSRLCNVSFLFDLQLGVYTGDCVILKITTFPMPFLCLPVWFELLFVDWPGSHQIDKAHIIIISFAWTRSWSALSVVLQPELSFLLLFSVLLFWILSHYFPLCLLLVFFLVFAMFIHGLLVSVCIFIWSRISS